MYTHHMLHVHAVQCSILEANDVQFKVVLDCFCSMADWCTVSCIALQCFSDCVWNIGIVAMYLGGGASWGSPLRAAFLSLSLSLYRRRWDKKLGNILPLPLLLSEESRQLEQKWGGHWNCLFGADREMIKR